MLGKYGRLRYEGGKNIYEKGGLQRRGIQTQASRYKKETRRTLREENE